MTIALNFNWGEPADSTTASIDAAERNMQWVGGWMANPIFGSNGDYPQIMIDKVLNRIFFIH